MPQSYPCHLQQCSHAMEAYWTGGFIFLYLRVSFLKPFESPWTDARSLATEKQAACMCTTEIHPISPAFCPLHDQPSNCPCPPPLHPQHTAHANVPAPAQPKERDPCLQLERHYQPVAHADLKTGGFQTFNHQCNITQWVDHAWESLQLIGGTTMYR